MTDDEWLRAAGADDTLVADLLMRLKVVKSKPSPVAPLPPPNPGLSLEWSVRQRRSKAVVVGEKKQAPWSSPTTPLSWSGATSISGGGGGSGSGAAFDGGPDEESSRPSPPLPLPSAQIKRSETSRSKVLITASDPSAGKRSRRKKTLAELKAEEDFLQKQKRQLKRELAALHLNLSTARSTNENLKRMKLELQVPGAAQGGSIVASEVAVYSQLQQKLAAYDPIPAILNPSIGGSSVSLQFSPPNYSSEGKKEVTAGKFVLPDLNLPFEEASIGGVS